MQFFFEKAKKNKEVGWGEDGGGCKWQMRLFTFFPKDVPIPTQAGKEKS